MVSIKSKTTNDVYDIKSDTCINVLKINNSSSITQSGATEFNN